MTERNLFPLPSRRLVTDPAAPWFVPREDHADDDPMLDVHFLDGTDRGCKCSCTITDRDERIWDRDCLKHPRP